ncbi:MAG: hypothetical protein A2V66_15605 [Ignavibacteria bacterium RBG_13_36_8]|nr:MAG: hypothetical protein A2V66_15605 [Ignavibacteria bacterium RBG_13_36_8]
MSREFLIKTILLVLFCLILLSAILHYIVKDSTGFFIGLSTTFIGLFIATFIVEMIIRNYESKIKSKTDRRVVLQVSRFINNFLLSLHTILKFEDNPYNWQDYSNEKFSNINEFMNTQLIKTTKKVVYPNLEGKLVNIDSDTYKKVISFFQNQITELDQISKKFNHLFSYELVPYMIDIDNSLNSIVNGNFYFIEQRYSEVEIFLKQKTAEPTSYLQNLSYQIKGILLKIFEISTYFENKYGIIPRINISDKFFNEK